MNSRTSTAQAIPPRRAVIAVLTMLAMMLIGAVFFFFDPVRTSFYPSCMFHKLTGLNCPGCGGLRALHHLTHGNLVTAFHCNPLLIALLPFLAALLLNWIKRGRDAFDSKTLLFRPATLWTLLAITLVFTVLRNLPGPAFAWMSP